MIGQGVRVRSNRWVLGVLCAAAVVEYFELNMMYVLLPTLYETFGSPAQVGWSITVFSLVGAASVAVGGRIGDIIGYRKVLIFALAASAVGSFTSAGAGELWQLILGRGIQGTAAVILPLALGLMRSVIRSTDRQKFGTGVIAGVGYSAAGLAPLTAGLLVSRFNWHAVFLVSGSLAVVVLLLVLTLPATRAGSGLWADVDIVGAVTLVPGIALLLVGITQITVWGPTDPMTLGFFAAGIIVLIGWFLYERRQRNPVVDMTLFRSRGYTVSCIGFVLFSLTLSVGIVLSILAQNPVAVGGFGMSAPLYGLFALLAVAFGTSMNFVGAWLTVRIGCRSTLIVGGLAQALGYGVASLVLVVVQERPLWLFALFMLSGIGNGIINTTLPAFVPEAVPEDKTGMALGVQQVLKQGSQAAGQQITAALLLVVPLVAATAGGPTVFPATQSLVVILAIAMVISLLIIPVAWFAPRVVLGSAGVPAASSAGIR